MFFYGPPPPGLRPWPGAPLLLAAGVTRLNLLAPSWDALPATNPYACRPLYRSVPEGLAHRGWPRSRLGATAEGMGPVPLLRARVAERPGCRGGHPPAMSARRRDALEAAAVPLVLGLIGVTTLARLLLGGVLGLSVDEAYTVVMARHPALGYFDHPPLTYWLVAVGTRVAGGEGPLAVRLPFVLLFGGTTWLVFRLGRLLFGPPSGLLGAVLLNLVLFFTVCAASWVLPDGPLLFFAAAATLCLAHAVFGPERAARRFWLGFGALTGVALLAKYHAVFLIGGVAAFLVITPGRRHWLRRPEPWLALGVAGLVFAPVLMWNAAHGWASLRFQGGRAGTLDPGYGSPFLDSVGGQALWMTPWLWLPMLLVLLDALRRGPREERRFLLACLAVGPIAGFTLLTALGVRGLAHWQAPGYFFVLPLLGEAVARRIGRGERWTTRWLWGSAVATALLVAALAGQALTGWLGRQVPGLFARGDPTQDLIPWDAVASQLAAWGQPAPGVVVAGSRWGEAGKLAYALGPAVEVTSVGEDPRGFRYVRAQEELIGRDVLLVADRRARAQEPMVAYAPYFQRIEPLGSVPLVRGGRAELEVSVYLARGLRAPIPEKRR